MFSGMIFTLGEPVLLQYTSRFLMPLPQVLEHCDGKKHFFELEKMKICIICIFQQSTESMANGLHSCHRDISKLEILLVNKEQ